MPEINCNEVLQKNKIEYSSKSELAERIYQQIETFKNKGKEFTDNSEFNIILPSEAGPIPLGFKNDMNYTKTDIENILNIYEGNTNKSFSQYSYVEFLSDKAIDAWKYCVSTNYKNKIAITSRIINNDILITVISPPVYKDLQITKLFATNADGILEEVQLNSKEKKITSNQTWSKEFSWNGEFDFFFQMLTDIYPETELIAFYSKKGVDNKNGEKEYIDKVKVPRDTISIGLHESTSMRFGPFKPGTDINVSGKFDIKDDACNLNLGDSFSFRTIIGLKAKGETIFSSDISHFYTYVNAGYTKVPGEKLLNLSAEVPQSGYVDLIFTNNESTCQGLTIPLTLDLIDISIIKESLKE